MVNSPQCVTIVAVSGNRAKKQQPLLFIDDNKFCRRRRAMDKLTNKIYRQLVILPLTSNVVDGKKKSQLFFYLPRSKLGYYIETKDHQVWFAVLQFSMLLKVLLVSSNLLWLWILTKTTYIFHTNCDMLKWHFKLQQND